MADVQRGLILRDDVAQFDGVTRTASRVDATGGTVTGLNFGDDVDVLQVFGGGENRTLATVNDAITRLGGAVGTLRFSTGTWTITDDLTIPSTVTCYMPTGAIFSVSSGKTLTISGYVVADASSWTSGDGTVNGDSSIPGIYYKRTALETSASVWGTDHSYIPGHIQRHGALGDGTDDGVRITNALKPGHPVYVPTGTWTCDTNCILLTGSKIFGDGPTSILKHTTTNGVLGVLTVNRASPFGSTDPDENLRDITIRDLKLLGTSSANGLSANSHLMPLRAASDILIENVHFEEFQGDGIYIGIGTGGEERHNRNITIRKCVFDGIDHTNRNGISVIDGDGILIEDCQFRNCTDTGQPGPIDVEPNDETQDIIRNITIQNNEFRNNKGGRCVGIWTPGGAMTKPFDHITISSNYMHADNDISGANIRFNGGETVSEALDPMHILIENNTILNTDQGIAVTGARGVKILNNTLVDGSISQVGRVDNASLSIMDCEVAGNVWQDCSNTTGTLLIGSVEHLEIHNNTFNPKDTASHDSAITLLGSGVTTVSKYVSIHDNIFIKATNQTHVVRITSHTDDPDTCSYYNNKIVGGPISINEIDTIATFESGDTSPSVQNSETFKSNATGVTIVQFDDGYAGQPLKVISKGATVYDTSPASRLVGSTVDVTTASGDITTWICETGGTSSSVWRLTGYVDISVDNSAGA